MDRAEQVRHYRQMYSNVAAALDEALAEAEQLAPGEALDFNLGRLGKLLTELGGAAFALRRHLDALRAPRAAQAGVAPWQATPGP
jgi:molybdopterin biosynthesis enzyme